MVNGIRCPAYKDQVRNWKESISMALQGRCTVAVEHMDEFPEFQDIEY